MREFLNRNLLSVIFVLAAFVTANSVWQSYNTGKVQDCQSKFADAYRVRSEIRGSLLDERIRAQQDLSTAYARLLVSAEGHPTNAQLVGIFATYQDKMSKLAENQAANPLPSIPKC